MRIEITEKSVKHGTETLLKGDVRTVTSELGNYFIASGWAVLVEGENKLEVQNVKIKGVAKNGR